MLSTATWTAVVNKKYLTSSTFKALDVAVKAYIGDKNNLPNLVKTWNAWTKKFHDKRQTYKNSDRYVVGGALDDIAALVGNANSGGALVVPPVGKPSAITPEAYVRGLKNELSKCEKYVCNDVGAFPQCIGVPEKHPDYHRIRNPGEGVIRTGGPIMCADRSWRATKLGIAYRSVEQLKAGECTNYAYYAAHVLTSSGQHPRVEIVSWEGGGRAVHLFCIVGRQGGLNDNFMLPPIAEWNHGVVIVDCWALTLGWGNCIFDTQNYCFKKTMMWPLKQQMDSSKEWDGQVDAMQGGLKGGNLAALLAKG